MSEFETAEDDVETEVKEEREPLRSRLSTLVKRISRRLVLLVSFGPGILGVLWLLGRIIKR